MAEDEKDNPIIKDKLKPFQEWREKFMEEWKKKQKEVIYEDEKGNVITPTTTTTTTTTPAPTPKPVTTKVPPINPTGNPVVTITGLTGPTTASGGRTEEVAAAETTQLIKIIGITCASLIGFILIALIVIRMCRRSANKRKQRLTVRRPLTETEREDHIYAEIEPLQRGYVPEGATGTSSDVQLPKKKGRRRRSGISSFRALSTRIYRFFNVDSDNQSVFYNRSEHQVENLPPEPPERNIANGRRTNKQVKRGESTASRRPLLDGDSRVSTSSGVDMRSNIYNPLIREDEPRQSGPYDHLTLCKTPSGTVVDVGPEPASPHDYFTLEKTANSENGIVSDGSDGKPLDTVVVENEGNSSNFETIKEEIEPSETPKNHDYFVLEPHEREIEANKSPSKNSVRSNHSPEKKNSSRSGSPVKGDKPDVTPRVTKASNKQSPSSPVTDLDDNIDSKGEEVKRSESKEETYVLAKLGDAPMPPDAVNDDEYLSPSEIEKKPEYVDVLPYPPPRSTSLQPHELSGKSSPMLGKKIVETDGLPAHKNGPTTPNTSPSKSSVKSSPTKSDKSSPTRISVSPTRSTTETTI
ncbi:hypothetical protein ACF0H5_014215 [Mactra antiquata]